ncbi:MAG: hypothetical protein HYU66_26730 [Armatimonadetes bacterium]|nr:hypothetical protein [Armatimonadota bacterium]
MTVRAVIVGLVGVAALSLFTPYSDLVLRGTWLGLTAFPISAFCALLVLLALNVPLRRAGHGLSRAELLGAYAMLLAAAGVASFGLTGLLVPYAAGPHYFATPENHYAETVVRYLPRWLLFPEPVSRALYEGLPPGAGLPASTWLRPAVGWGILIAGVHLVLFSLAALVRRPWVENERLVFPLVQLPVYLTTYEPGDNVPSYLRNPVVWVFFAVPFLLHAVNGLHHHVPAVPAVNIHRIDLGAAITGKLGEAISPFWLRGLFTVIGLTYLLPSDVGFSLWFFYCLFLGEQILGARLGYTMTFVQAFPVRRFVALQMIGGVLVSGVHLVWNARAHLAGLLRRRGAGDEAMSPRGLWLALAGGWLLIGAWAELVGAGWGWVAVLFALFFLFQLVATRLVAEGGMLYVQHPFRPLNLLLTIRGTAGLGPPRLPALALLDHLWMLDNRSPLQPAVLQGWKLAEAGGLPLRAVSRAMALAVALAVPLSLGSYVSLMLRHGGLSLNPWFTSYYTNNLFSTWSSHLVLHGEAAQPRELGWVALGGVTMGTLLRLHHVFWRWPLHPIGYLMGASWPMINFWFPVLVGWLLKSLTLRYGGAKLYRRLLPGFLALILAEYASAGLWVVIDALAGVRGHEIFTF